MRQNGKKSKRERMIENENKGNNEGGYESEYGTKETGQKREVTLLKRQYV